MEKEETLLTQQDMVVKTQPDASIPTDAKYQAHHSYKEELSLHDLLSYTTPSFRKKTASSNASDGGTSEKVEQREKLTLDDILGQLQQVASKTKR